MSRSNQQCFVSFALVFVPSAVLINAVGWTFLVLFIQLKDSGFYVHGNSLDFLSARIPSVSEFFPQIQSDLSKVKWGHGINSRLQLGHSLQGRDMMIEADVSLGTVLGSSKLIPIMAHPPFKISDLSLEEFMDTVINSKLRKGIKLDFKDLDVVEMALEILKARVNKIRFPLFLNADIIPGPVNATTKPLDAQIFLNLSKTYFPNAVLSVGWTTRYGPDITAWPLQIITEGTYTMEQMQKLSDAIKQAGIEQPLTFPIRAGLSVKNESQQSITWLLDQFPDSTLSLWSGIFDTVDVPALMNLIDNVGRHRIYIDVPSGLLCEIRHFGDPDD